MQPLSQAIPKVVEVLLRTGPVSQGKVEFAWKAAVGSGIGRVSRVRLEERTLIVEAHTEAWAREISRSSRLLVTRLQRLLGDDAIDSIIVRHA